MADTVSTKTILSTRKRGVVVLHGASDGTGETDAIKISKATLATLFTATIPAIQINWIQYDIQGYTNITLEWDLTTDEPIARLGSGTGYLQFAEDGTMANGAKPTGTGATGDVVLTTSGHISGGSYTIIVGYDIGV